jgi:hypothetical protein
MQFGGGYTYTYLCVRHRHQVWVSLHIVEQPVVVVAGGGMVDVRYTCVVEVDASQVPPQVPLDGGSREG